MEKFSKSLSSSLLKANSDFPKNHLIVEESVKTLCSYPIKDRKDLIEENFFKQYIFEDKNQDGAEIRILLYVSHN